MSSFILAASTAALLLLGPAASADDRVVESGETLREIAEEYGVTVQQIAAANGIDNPDLLRVGQVLHIPVGGKGVKTVTHVVAAGDTLGSLAVRYGTTVAAIAEANAIANPDLIRSGWTLTITSGSGGGDGGGGGGGGGQYYEVRAGDTLGNIANAFGVSSNAILAVNDIADPDVLRLGQKLLIPSSSTKKTGGDGGGGGGGTRCPVPSGWFKNDYGYVKPTGKVHRGIDVYASRGAKVLAPASGTVELINGPIGGLQFWLYASDGTRYIGTHLEAYGKSGKVSAGDVVGYVGTTGNAVGTPPHLHFEIAEGGDTISPYSFLVSHC